ncbi:MAG: nitrous oxide-stimulated promoter family protein [Mogibacterium diversum]|uniref:nitrous oxide-stimulated promoter family protein n=1 Tax=Mogibacterium diversum TaxID=114527 RepID=UPI00205183A9|nr:nitrous oxide-stimulated promoter family protein [Mogibacterium diversum]UQF82044.1 MAG: nitrous oxide-stimulated promoter family protein [Mogibacterium diversum]
MESSRIKRKRQKEIMLVSQMIKLYCHKNHTNQNGKELCDECQELIEYACERSEKCRFMKNKTFCSNCRIQCYSPEMKKRIQKVMRYSGPRIIIYHPLLCLRHVITGAKEKRRTRCD